MPDVPPQPNPSSAPAGSPVRVLVGSPAVGEVTEQSPEAVILLDLGDDHPSRAGLLELRLWPAAGGADGTETDHDQQLGGRLIGRAEVVVGAMHRGAEKLYEVRDYRQILMLADRHDWQAPAAAELAIACACEELLGLEVPVRAQWLRTLLAEHNRILSHLGFLGYLWNASGRPSPIPQLRERLRHQLQHLTGNRVHPMINRLGGLAADADDQWLAAELELLSVITPIADQAVELIMEEDRPWQRRRIRPLTPELVRAYGVSGPAARAAGVDLDLRRRRPYLAYGELTEELIIDSEVLELDGSVPARLWMLAAEIGSSVRIIRSVIGRLRELPGPVNVRLGKIIKLPEGEIYLGAEAPLGTAGCYLVSRGEKTPWRLKLRTPSFNNVAALEALLPGCRVEDVESVLASMGYVVGDIDK